MNGIHGNGFLVAKKVSAFMNYRKEKVLVVNGVECEPGLIHDQWLLEKEQEKIEQIAAFLGQLFGAAKVVVASKLALQSKTNGINEVQVPNRYPMGEEHCLLKQLFDVEIAFDKPPVEEGYLVMNVQTVEQIGRILCGQYDGSRYLTIGDLTTGEGYVVRVNASDSIQQMVKKTVGKTKEIVAGSGVMSGHIIEEDECFGMQISFAGVVENIEVYEDHLCKKCGNCSRKCPAHIRVKDLVQAIEQKRSYGKNEFLQQQCVHCGSCNYYCPAQKNVGALVNREV